MRGKFVFSALLILQFSLNPAFGLDVSLKKIEYYDGLGKGCSSENPIFIRALFNAKHVDITKLVYIQGLENRDMQFVLVKHKDREGLIAHVFCAGIKYKHDLRVKFFTFKQDGSLDESKLMNMYFNVQLAISSNKVLKKTPPFHFDIDNTFQIGKETSPKERACISTSFGTGWPTLGGYVVTNYHVVGECKNVTCKVPASVRDNKISA